MIISTNSQIAETYVFNVYPCLSNWIAFVKASTINSMQYDSLSCNQLALICKSAMKTIDYILAHESSASVIRVSRMLNDLHDYAWRLWTVFIARGKNTLGVATITLTSTALQNLSTLVSWDIALNQNPTSFRPPILFNAVLNGVTL
jgi:hypothetical protein